MNTPDVTIIIPNYNCLSFLPSCFDSIKRQHHVNYEVLVIDDGSNDGSLEWLEQQAALWPQLSVVQQARKGPGAARNLAAQIARAPLLAFLDADDTWPVDKLASQVDFHQQNPDVGLTFTDYMHVNESTGESSVKCFDYWPEFSRLLKNTKSTGTFERLEHATARLLAENVIGTSSAMVTRSAFMAVSGFDVSLPSASDWDLWLKLSKITGTGFSRHCLMDYLQRQGSVSSNYAKRFLAVDTILSRHLDDMTPYNPATARSALVARAIAKHEMYVGNREYFKALKCSLQALWLHPNKRQVRMTLRDVLAATLRC